MACAPCSRADDEEGPNQQGEAASGDMELQARGVREKAAREARRVHLLAQHEERDGVRRDGEAEQQQEQPSGSGRVALGAWNGPPDARMKRRRATAVPTEERRARRTIA
jgi:hypothetical protein